MKEIPCKIGDDERLGRELFSKRHARTTIPVHVFKGGQTFSVDRLDFASDAELIEIGDKNAKARNRNFYGWAVIGAEAAKKESRTLAYDPTEDNPYHSHIHLPDHADEEAHALALSSASKFKPAEQEPSPSEGSTADVSPPKTTSKKPST